jgi:hypothetical protein
VFILHPTVIAWGIKHEYIERREDGRIFFINSPFDDMNGCEVFPSKDSGSVRHGYEVSTILFDELKDTDVK